MADQRTELTQAEALRLLLDQVDYTAGACRMTELIGAVLSIETIKICRAALARPDPEIVAMIAQAQALTDRGMKAYRARIEKLAADGDELAIEALTLGRLPKA